MNRAVREPDGRRAREEQEHQGTRLKQLLTRRELRVLVALEQLKQRLAKALWVTCDEGAHVANAASLEIDACAL